MGFSPNSGSTQQTASAPPTSGTYTVGQRIYNSNPSAGGSEGWVCVVAGTGTNLAAWAPNTQYTVGQQVTSNGNIYKCTTAGNSGAIPPSGTGISITASPPQGTPAWQPLSPTAATGVGSTIAPNAGSAPGLYFTTNAAGTTALTEPTWPTANGGNVTDNVGVPAWAPNTAYSYQTSLVTPTTANGKMYLCEQNGTSCDTEPVWPTTGSNFTEAGNCTKWSAGLSVSAGECVIASSGAHIYYYTASAAGTTGSTEPTWPTSNNSTVTDNGITWTAHQAIVWNIENIVSWTANQSAVFQYVGPVAVFKEFGQVSN